MLEADARDVGVLEMWRRGGGASRSMIYSVKN